jgi:hypothetical protein
MLHHHVLAIRGQHARRSIGGAIEYAVAEGALAAGQCIGLRGRDAAATRRRRRPCASGWPPFSQSWNVRSSGAHVPGLAGTQHTVAEPRATAPLPGGGFALVLYPDSPASEHPIMPHEKTTIGGKDVYVVESHHHVLQSWAEIRRSLTAAPVLLTLDHHTDTEDPFHRHRFAATCNFPQPPDVAAMEAMLPGMIANLRYDDEASVMHAIDKLHNDEHVWTAIRARIVSRGFVIHLSSGTNREPSVLYETGSICAIGCMKASHDDECTSLRSAQVLESVYLDQKLKALNTMAAKDGVPAVEAEPYVLDIDLDYFHSERAIEPDDPNTFYRLVRNAVAVTIATEPTWVKNCRDKGSNVTGESLLEGMKRHLKAALK